MKSVEKHKSEEDLGQDFPTIPHGVLPGLVSPTTGCNKHTIHAGASSACHAPTAATLASKQPTLPVIVSCISAAPPLCPSVLVYPFCLCLLPNPSRPILPPSQKCIARVTV